MELEAVDCPTCGPFTIRPVLRASDINLFGPGEFQVVRCQGCGLVYVNPRPTPEGMAAYYPREYWAPPPPEGQCPSLDAGMRRALRLLARDCPGGRVLDVGCGVGTMAAMMRQHGLSAIGLEPYEAACQVAREHYGLEVVCSVLQEADLPEGTFDAITFFDVLEHLHDPIGDLRRSWSLLKPGGIVIVKVPNFGALQARLFGRWWYWLDVPRHLFHFTPSSLGAVLRTAGFGHVSSHAIPDRVGAVVFETSIIYWLRGRLLAARGVQVAPAKDESVGKALEGQVYGSVPKPGKQAFRWLVRNVLYAPLAVENLIGRSVVLFAVARK